jgi:proton-dependent oligopeptide transporter, POT family
LATDALALRDHPRALLICSATEFWERFSYYGMRSLLVFYLTQHFLFSDSTSYLLYGTYSATVYLTPVLGGVIADRFLGARQAVTLGAVLLVFGHCGLALEGLGETAPGLAGRASALPPTSASLQTFYLSLALIATGVGFLKTNATTLVGSLYGPDDPRRDAGFTLFYMVYNVGGALAPLLCGWVGAVYGWSYGFGLAGLGMMAGLWVFLRGQREFAGMTVRGNAELLQKPWFGLNRATVAYLSAIAIVAAVWGILGHSWITGPLLATVGGVMGIVILYNALSSPSALERDRLLVCAMLLVSTIGFWAIYEQIGSSLNVFAARMVDRHALGIEIPAPTLQSLPPIFVILGAPLASSLWLALARRGRDLTPAVKFSLGIAQLGLAFLVLSWGAGLGRGQPIGLGWLVASLLLLSTGELCVAPVSMAMVTALAPKRIVGMMTGALFLAYSASGFLSGLIAQLTSARTIGGNLVDRAAALKNYAAVYGRLGALALGAAGLLVLISPILRRRMHRE